MGCFPSRGREVTTVSPQIDDYSNINQKTPLSNNSELRDQFQYNPNIEINENDIENRIRTYINENSTLQENLIEKKRKSIQQNSFLFKTKHSSKIVSSSCLEKVVGLNTMYTKRDSNNTIQVSDFYRRIDLDSGNYAERMNFIKLISNIKQKFVLKKTIAEVKNLLENSLINTKINFNSSSDSYNVSENVEETEKFDEKKIKTIFTNLKTNDEGNQQINNYLLLGMLGMGSYGNVRLGYNLNEKIYNAIKIINKAKMRRSFFKPNSENQFNPIENEKKNLREIESSFCVELLDILEDDTCVYLVFEYMENGSLNNLISSNTQINVRKYFRDLITGLDYLHNKAEIVHFDIKPDNLLINEEDTLKISDFGISKKYEITDLFASYKYASPCYVSPEMTLPNNPFYGKKVDIWACGIVLYFMVYKKLPFTVNNQKIQDLYEQIRTKKVEFCEEIDESLKDLINRMLEKNPDNRISLNDIKIHPWFTDHGNEPYVNIHGLRKKNKLVTKEVIFKALIEDGVLK